MEIPCEIEEVIRECIRGVFLGDLKRVEKAALPHPEMHLLTQRPPPVEGQRERMENDLQNLQPKIVDGREAHLTLQVYFLGNIMPVSLVQTKDGWKVDIRWWLGGMRKPTEQENLVRAFAFGLLTNDEEVLNGTTTDMSALRHFLGGRPPAGEMGQYEHTAMNLPVIELQVGDEFRASDGTIAKADERCIGPEKKMMIAQLHGVEVPIPLLKVNGEWRVNPGPLVMMMSRGAQQP